MVWSYVDKSHAPTKKNELIQVVEKKKKRGKGRSKITVVVVVKKKKPCQLRR